MRQTLSQPHRPRNTRAPIANTNNNPASRKHSRILTRSLQNDSKNGNDGRNSDGVFPPITVAHPADQGTRDALSDVDGGGVEGEGGGRQVEVVGIAWEDV